MKNRYMSWLKYYGAVNIDPYNKYNLLIKRLYERPFMAKLQNDINRVHETLLIRQEYKDTELPTGVPAHLCDDVHPHMQSETVSFLELVISLAIRGDDVTDDEDKDMCFWFWGMLSAVELTNWTDEAYESLGGNKAVDEILEKINMRTFRRDGKGSFFPLRYSKVNQQKVEMWYQMCTMIEQEGW